MLADVGASLVVAGTGEEAELVRLVADADAILTCFAHVTPAVIRAARSCESSVAMASASTTSRFRRQRAAESPSPTFRPIAWTRWPSTCSPYLLPGAGHPSVRPGGPRGRLVPGDGAADSPDRRPDAWRRRLWQDRADGRTAGAGLGMRVIAHDPRAPADSDRGGRSRACCAARVGGTIRLRQRARPGRAGYRAVDRRDVP